MISKNELRKVTKMKVSEKSLRLLIKQSLIENKILQQEAISDYVPDSVKKIGKKAYKYLSGEENPLDFKKPGDVCGMRSNPNLTVVTLTGAKRFNNTDYVIVININKGQKLVTSDGKAAVSGANFSDNFQYWWQAQGSSYKAVNGKKYKVSYKSIPNLKKLITSEEWLRENFLNPSREGREKNDYFYTKSKNFDLSKFAKMVKNAMDDGRVAIGESSKMANNFEAKILEYEKIGKEVATNTYTSFIGWSGPLLTVIEMIPGAQPLIPVIEGLKQITSAEDLRIKIYAKDYIAASFAVVGLIPAVGEAFEGVGKAISNAALKGGANMPFLKIVQKIPKFNEAIEAFCEVLGKYVVGNEAYATLENFIKNLFGEKFKIDEIMPNLQAAMKDIYNFFKYLGLLSSAPTKENEKKFNTAKTALAAASKK